MPPLAARPRERLQKDGLDCDAIRGFLRRWGSCSLAYSTLRPSARYFIVEDRGYVAYDELRHRWLAPKGRDVVIGDPICALDDLQAMVRAFLDGRGPTAFVGFGRATASVLDRLGWKVNEIGYEARIPVSEFGLGGPRKAALRRLCNKARREGITVTERSPESVNRSIIERISSAWLEQKGHRQHRLLSRPLRWSSEAGVRWFWAMKGGEPVAVMTFDPCYVEGRVACYYQNFVRYGDDAPHGTTDLMTCKAIDLFAEQGVTELSFGLSPLAGIEDETSTFESNRLLTRLLRLLYNHGERVYSFRGNAFYRRRYLPSKEKLYFAATGGGTIREVLSVLRVTELI